MIEAADGTAGCAAAIRNVRIDLLVTDVGSARRHERAAGRGRGADRPAGLKVLFITGYAENAVLEPWGQLDPGMQS